MTCRKTRDLALAEKFVETAKGFRIPATIEDKNKHGWYCVNFDISPLSTTWAAIRSCLKITAKQHN